MKILKTSYICDGPDYHRGMRADVVQIETPEDYDRLWNNIIATEYYSLSYFDRVTGRNRIEVNHLLMAAIVDSLRGRSVFELGCGIANELLLIALLGDAKVAGVDLSREIVDQAPKPLAGKLIAGELLDTARRLSAEGIRYDTIIGFDIWEHLHPAQLDETVQAVAALGTDDVIALFIIPGFGHDQVFGEIFPLEFEENRAAFDERRPFPYLLLEQVNPPIPASGHLTWTHVEGWEKLFANNGFVRAKGVERLLQRSFGAYLHYARRSFFVLTKPTAAAERRLARLTGKDSVTYVTAFRTMNRLAKRLPRWEQAEEGGPKIAWDKIAQVSDGMADRISQAAHDRIQFRLYQSIDSGTKSLHRWIDSLNHYLKQGANGVAHMSKVVVRLLCSLLRIM